MTITTEFTVWCTSCSDWEQEAGSKNKSGAIKIFREQGWKKEKTGWKCPTCKKN